MNVLELPAHEPTRLVTNPTQRRVPTPYSSTDATGALTRGIAEYAASLSLTPGGPPAFVKCFDEWANLEDDACYPSFVAYTNENDGNYEASSFTPNVSTAHRYPDGTYEISSAELAIDVKCEIWANDPNERAQLIAMLEAAFNPVDWMYGFRLELPHYFNQRATFEPSRITRLGGAQEALQRFVNARMIVHANVPVTRVLPFAQARPVVRTTVANGAILPPTGAIVVGVDTSENP